MKKTFILIILLIGAIFITGCESKRKESNTSGSAEVINSRRKSYLNTVSAYIDSVRAKVNEAKKLRLFETETLFLVPVTCAKLESGGTSPFSNKWQYAYVGVEFTADLYSYYAVTLDGAGYGINMLPYSKIYKNDSNDVINSESLTNISELIDNYKISENKSINYTELSNEFKNMIDNSNIKVKSVVFISSDSCSYQK